MDWDGAVLSLMAWAFTDDGSKHEKLKEWHFEHMSKFDDPNIRLKSPVDLDAFQQLKSRMIQINRGDNDYIKKPAYLNFAEHRLNAALRKFDEAVLFQAPKSSQSAPRINDPHEQMPHDEQKSKPNADLGTRARPEVSTNVSTPSEYSRPEKPTDKPYEQTVPLSSPQINEASQETREHNISDAVAEFQRTKSPTTVPAASKRKAVDRPESIVPPLLSKRRKSSPGGA
ncbi:hypothetical protein LTS18_012786, partial [Coniosporium uncinatum]